MSGGEVQRLHPTVYVESTVVSYLAAPGTGDLVTRGHKESTRRWWANRARWDLVVSPAVLIEIMRGDHATALRRLELLAGIPVIAMTPAAKALAAKLLDRGPLPAKARVDAEHIAISTVNGLDYLVTWNLKHIANPGMRHRIDAICRSAGYEPPVICTPEALLES